MKHVKVCNAALLLAVTGGACSAHVPGIVTSHEEACSRAVRIACVPELTLVLL
jgi:hypothetical protein